MGREGLAVPDADAGASDIVPGILDGSVIKQGRLRETGTGSGNGELSPSAQEADLLLPREEETWPASSVSRELRLVSDDIEDLDFPPP